MIRLAAVGRDVAFSPDGSMLAIAEADIDGSAIRLWNASTGQEIRTLIRACAFSNTVAQSDGRFVAGGLGDGALHVWGSTGERLSGWPRRVGRSCRWTSTRPGRVVTASQDRLVEVWNARTGARSSRWRVIRRKRGALRSAPTAGT